MTDTLTLTRPDDWHLHVRDGSVLNSVVPATAACFGRAIIMPNLVPPVVTGADAAAYRDRIMTALPEDADFTPLMTLYLTEDTDPEDVARAFAEGLIHAVKLYPAGATPIPPAASPISTRSPQCSTAWPRSACRSAPMAR